MQVSYLLGPESPVPMLKLPEIQETNDTNFLQKIQTILNRNPPRLKRKLPVKDSESSEDEEINKKPKKEKVEAIQGFLAVDPVSGHVLVQFVGSNDIQWLPYMYLRWACSSLTNKKWMETEVHSRWGKPIPIQYDVIPRISITNFVKVVPLHYIPALYDGTLFGNSERIIYRIFGRNRIGVTTLALLGGCEGIGRFVDIKRQELVKAGRNATRLTKCMGLNLIHDDIGPRFIGSVFPFKHYSFGFGPNLMELERSAIDFLGTLKK